MVCAYFVIDLWSGIHVAFFSLRCEYIFYRGLYRTSYARISRGIITDTETQIGQFVLPRHGHNVTDDSLQVRYLRSRKEELPVEHVRNKCRFVRSLTLTPL